MQLLTVYSGTLVLAAAVSFTDVDVGWGTAIAGTSFKGLKCMAGKFSCVYV